MEKPSINKERLREFRKKTRGTTDLWKVYMATDVAVKATCAVTGAGIGFRAGGGSAFLTFLGFLGGVASGLVLGPAAAKLTTFIADVRKERFKAKSKVKSSN